MNSRLSGADLLVMSCQYYVKFPYTENHFDSVEIGQWHCEDRR